jgi:hypothetical protein
MLLRYGAVERRGPKGSWAAWVGKLNVVEGEDIDFALVRIVNREKRRFSCPKKAETIKEGIRTIPKVDLSSKTFSSELALLAHPRRRVGEPVDAVADMVLSISQKSWEIVNRLF